MICAVTSRERMLRGVLSIVIAAFAVSSWGTWAVVPAAICALLLLVGAITGWCPMSPFTLSGRACDRQPSKKETPCVQP